VSTQPPPDPYRPGRYRAPSTSNDVIEVETDPTGWVPPYRPARSDDPRGRPTGFLQPPARRERHRCAPPVTGWGSAPGSLPDAPTGAAWRCPCGRLWAVTDGPGPHRGHECPLLRHLDPVELGRGRCGCPTWRRAGWLTRWRYRHAASAETARWEAEKRAPGSPPEGKPPVLRPQYTTPEPPPADTSWLQTEPHTRRRPR
jgi:hypothetical protein